MIQALTLSDRVSQSTAFHLSAIAHHTATFKDDLSFFNELIGIVEEKIKSKLGIKPEANQASNSDPSKTNELDLQS